MASSNVMKRAKEEKNIEGRQQCGERGGGEEKKKKKAHQRGIKRTCNVILISTSGMCGETA